MRATEFIVEGLSEGSLNEYRDQLWTWVQSKFPRTQWPEYVQRDFLYAKAKGNKNQKDLEDFLDEIQRDFGRVRWQLEKLPITLDIFTPKTQRMIQSREGGSSNPYQVPKDAERHAQQSQMIQQKGVSEEPIIVAKLSNGYDLIEGWHRTIQHLKEFPQGYTAPAWVGYGATYTSESVEQGVAEGNFDSFKFGKPITFTAYHSSDSEIKRILPTDEFYFSDDRYTWEGNYLYKIKITLKNPYVVLDQKAGYEGHATDSLPKIKAAGYDGVIYTPHSVDYGFRQGVCFYPQQQISNIKLVNSDSGK